MDRRGIQRKGGLEGEREGGGEREKQKQRERERRVMYLPHSSYS
jgi:hypothetical protein